MKKDSPKASQNPRETSERQSTITRLAPTLTTIGQLKRAAANCKACDLWKRATQTVFGEGLAKAEVMFVGEEPGDQEDTAGRPFVGPAGKLLDRALAEAGIDRSQVYVTNVVKHFKWAASERASDVSTKSQCR